MLFPANAVQRGKFQGTACTTSVSHPQTGLNICTNNKVTILANNNNDTFRLYQVTFSAPRALNYQLYCGSNLIQAHLGTSMVLPTNVICNSTFEYAYLGVTTDTFVSIVYGTTTPTMATSTPFTEVTQDVYGNTEYHYNPLSATVGIFLFLIAFVVIVYGGIKVYKEW